MSKLYHQNHGPMKVVYVKLQPPVRMSRLRSLHNNVPCTYSPQPPVRTVSIRRPFGADNRTFTQVII